MSARRQRGHSYLYLVENEREGGRVRQRIIRALGRKDVLLASDELERLATSLARHCDRAVILSDIEAGRIACTRIGGQLLFGRIRERLGIAAVLDELLQDRGFEFAVERAVFASVLHRLFVSGSDRSCDKWMADYQIAGIDGLQLHHLYRAMAWLGEETASAAPGALAPRCIKDLIEERLFERRRDLFSDLSLVFMDTTSLAFCGAGGDSLGAHGHSKDHRPDLKQMILAVVIDGEGRPICTEMLPGNTADTTVLLPVVDRLHERFHIGRVCVVADRGMISAATIAALEERKLEYILGARERSSTVIRRLVLDDEQPLTPLLVERVRGETQLFVKEVKVGTARYILCRNAAEAERDRSERQPIVAGLAKQLARGDKALIGNSAYRRYLRRTPGASGKPGPAFEIDPGKLADEARYDGLFVPDQRQDHAAAGRLALPRSVAGRRPIPPRQGDPQDPPNLPFLRRRHPWACLLLVPRPDAAERAGRPVPQPRPRRRMGRPVARSRPSPGSDHREGRQAHHYPHRRRRPSRSRLPGRRRRPAAQSARTRRLKPPMRV